jgi:4-hydroxy-4-methyl-2-oxoglutarate aldolase
MLLLGMISFAYKCMEVRLIMNNQELLKKIMSCRLADLSDGMDAIGLVNTGTMSGAMRPIRPGISMVGFAYTVKLLPSQKDVKVYKNFDEYKKELDKWCGDTYSFFGPIAQGKYKDENIVVVIDMGGYPGGIWGSEIGMNAVKNGVIGAVIDGACRDSYECNLEGVKVWCTARTFNHVYGRLVNGGVNIPIRCAGVMVNPGDIVCADDDGVLVIPKDRAEEVLEFAQRIREEDQKVRAKHYKDLGLPYDETLGVFSPDNQ